MTRVKNSKVLKLIAVMVAMVLMMACLPVTSYAATYAISGSGSATGTSGTFYVDSPAMSVFGHITISVSNQTSATIRIIDPNGRNLTPGGGAGFISVSAGSTININVTNAPAGRYEIFYAANNGNTVTVSVSLHDWWA